MFNGKIFALAYLDNQLNLIKDQWIDKYNDRQINKMLDQLILIYPNKSVKEIIDKLILDISDKLPLIAISLNKIFAYNQQRLFESIIIIYKIFYYKKNDIHILKSINNGLFNLILMRMRNGLKKEYYFNNYDSQTLLSAKNLHLLILYIVKEYQIQIKTGIRRYYIYPELLIYLYQHNKFINQYKKKISIINLIIQIIIIDIQNEILHTKRYKHVNTERQYILLFRFINENWNNIKIKYKNIIKMNINQWQQFIQMANYDYYNQLILIINEIKNY